MSQELAFHSLAWGSTHSYLLSLTGRTRKQNPCFEQPDRTRKQNLCLISWDTPKATLIVDPGLLFRRTLS